MNDTRQRMNELLEASRAKRLPPAGGLTVTAVSAVAVVPRKDQVKHRCGHAVGLAHYEQQECAECKVKTRQARAERRKSKQAAKPKPVKERLDDRGRLPGGVWFTSKPFDEENLMWTAYLHLPDGRVFEAEHTSWEEACREASRQYRATVKGATE